MAKSKKKSMTVAERNWLIVVLLLFAAMVLFVFYSLVQTNYSSNGVFQTPKAHTTTNTTK
jgi:CHASE3 domain sensor protein